MDAVPPAPKHVGTRLLALLALASAVVVVPLGMGLREPTSHQATYVVTLRSPRGEVYRKLADLAGWQSWNPYVGPLLRRGADRFETHPDPRTSLFYVLRSATPETRVVVELRARPRRLGATWTFTLRDAGAGTRVAIHESGWTSSPTQRFAMRYLVGYDVALVGLARALERSEAPGQSGSAGTSPP